MYEAFFGLSVKPFELVPNPDFLYQGRSHRKARNYLKYGLNERAGFILLTGEVGSGKTTIIRDFLANLEENIVPAMVFNTKVSTKQVLAMINEDFGLPVTGRDKVALLRELNDFLVELHAQNKYPVLIIDEAQNLSPAGLEEIRLLSNLEATDAKLLQIIMVGQTELKETIAKYELRQLRQRINVHCHLEPFTREETEEYVYHRLELAGNRNAANWGEGTFDLLFKHSQGVPRLINIFCDFILLDAYVEGTRDLSSELVEEVICDTAWEKNGLKDEALTGGVRNGARQGIIGRITNNEQRLAHLEEISSFNNEYSQRIETFENLLLLIKENQNKGFQKIEKILVRINKNMTELNEKEQKVSTNNDSEISINKLRTGLLDKLFF